MHVHEVRLGLSTQLLQALQTERELLRRQSPTRDVAQAVAVVDQRISYAQSLVANFTQLRDAAAAGQLVQRTAHDVLEVYRRFLGEADTAAQSQGMLALARAALHRQAPGAWQTLTASRR